MPAASPLRLRASLLSEAAIINWWAEDNRGGVDDEAEGVPGTDVPEHHRLRLG